MTEHDKDALPRSPGPIGDEWDSPGYDAFWSPIERAADKRILDANKRGRESELKRLSFAEGMLVLVETGQKTNTIRRHKPGINDFAEGEVFIGEFAEGADLTLRATSATEVKPFRALTDIEARANGCHDVAEALRGLKGYYPDLQPSDLMVVIHFEIYPETFVSRSPFMQGEPNV